MEENIYCPDCGEYVDCEPMAVYDGTELIGVRYVCPECGAVIVDELNDDFVDDFDDDFIDDEDFIDFDEDF